MPSLRLASLPETATTIKCRLARVYVDGQQRRDLVVLSWEEAEAPRFGKVALALRSQATTLDSKRIQDLTALPPMGSEILIVPADITVGKSFRGIVSGHKARFSESDETLVAEVDHYLMLTLSVAIQSRWHIEQGGPVEIDNANATFNTGPETLASQETVTIKFRQARLFDATASAKRWSVADALGYLIATNIPADIEVPTQNELDSLAGDIDLGTVNVSEMTVVEAMVKVAQRGGLRLRSASRGSGLVVYRPGKDGQDRSVMLQPFGSDLSLRKSNLWRGQLVFRRRPSRRSVLALGEYKQYESTLTLSKGWDPSLETARWRDFVRSESTAWSAVADVYRKWVLNEHGRYCTSPWNLTAHDFSSISSDDFLVLTPRKFLPCLSTDVTGQSLGVVVEFRCGAGAGWRRWTAPVWISNDECAVYLGGDALPSEFFQATVSNDAELRVTGTVLSDSRLAVEITGDRVNPREIIDLSDRAAWRKVHTTSLFHNQSGLGVPNERNDTDLLTQTARRHAEITSRAAEAKLTLGWVNTSYHVGDIIDKVEGRHLELSSNCDTRPHVISVRHDFGTAQSTILEIGG